MRITRAPNNAEVEVSQNSKIFALASLAASFLNTFFFTFSYFNIPIFKKFCARFACGFFTLRIFLLYKFRCFSDPNSNIFALAALAATSLYGCLYFSTFFCLTYQEGNS
ncbi:hypothetical protein B5X24_HaOG204898 [Helicoverpa armigera]|uniref:Uncharacterized protein n=1 Tax=Helicoverpa armigera TaxID=29058 RepID=A0A2W1BMQ9_HELAM|nr:hypothetical protein B5X24_HaOG204898 [Helicoverpa armigera]